VIICCVAIFWLLKYHEPNSTERARRRAKRDAENSSAKLVSTSKRSFNPFRSWTGGQTKASDLEIQKPPFDDSDRKLEVDKDEYDYPYVSSTRSGYGSVPNDQHHEHHYDTRMSTVELHAPSPGHVPIISRGVDPPFKPPYKTESPPSDLEPPSLGSSVYQSLQQDERNFSNPISVGRFHNGTKFMEQI